METPLKYRVFDEMGFGVIFTTDNLQEAQDCAYNHQCLLIDNLTDKVIYDYSC